MLVAVLSDIHGNLPALEAVVADARGCEAVFNLGEVPGLEMIAVAYDHQAAAPQAERNGRPDWAPAFLHGRMDQS